MPPQQSQAPQSPNQPTIQDDQLAAALGFLTTISELHMGMGQQSNDQNKPPADQKPTDMQNNGSQTAPQPPKQPQDTSSGPDEDKKRDEAMQKEIDDIRAELEKLQKEEKNGTDTTTTEDTQSAG